MVEGSVITSVTAVAMSDIGLVRSRNEDGTWIGDRFLRTGSEVSSFTGADLERGLVLAVADGVGGAAAGDVASKFVLDALGATAPAAPASAPAESVCRWLEQTALAINDSLVERAASQTDLYGMSTTMTGLFMGVSTVCWVNAGDSRLYALRDGTLVQVTRDHTLREMAGDPRIPGNIIVNCFGTREDFYADTGEIDTPAELYLLCSDGLSDYTSPDGLERIVVECGRSDAGALMSCAHRLVDAAKAGGGADNITALLVVPQYG
jgi:protein phosphatase